MFRGVTRPGCGEGGVVGMGVGTAGVAMAGVGLRGVATFVSCWIGGDTGA